MYYIENNTWARGDMEFIFECSHTNNDVFDDFPKISEEFPKLFRRLNKRLRTFSEDFQGADDVSYSTTSEYFLSDYVAKAMAILRLEISYFYM